MIGLSGTGTGGSGATAPRRSATPRTEVTPPAPPAPPIIDADQLSAAYEQNEVAADQAYKGKRLRISGRVQNVGKDILDTPFIALGSGSVPKVQAMFSKSDESRLAGIRAGEMITVECTGGGKLGWVFARKCVVQ